MNQRLKRTPGIYLVGFMGCGKSTIGRLLAEQLGWPFADLDEEIEKEQQTAIIEIFERRGEAEFRRIETAALRRHVRQVEAGRPVVLALGGGVFAQPQNAELLAENGITIWLDCPLEILERRVARSTHRPLARDPEHFARLFRERATSYARADYRVAVSDDPPTTHAAAILRLPLF